MSKVCGQRKKPISPEKRFQGVSEFRKAIRTLYPKKKNDDVKPSFLSVLRLNRHDFFFFFGADVVDLFAILVGHFLHFLFEAFPLIFRQFLILF